MLIIEYNDIPMCATCKFISIGTAHYTSGDKKICVCRYFISKSRVTEIMWYGKCNLYSNVKYNDVIYIIDISNKI